MLHVNFTEAMESCNLDQSPNTPASTQARAPLTPGLDHNDSSTYQEQNMQAGETQVIRLTHNTNTTDQEQETERSTHEDPVGRQDRDTTENQSTSVRSTGQLNCLLINTRSMKKHKNEFRDTLEAHNPDLAFITETWLNDHDQTPTLHEAIPPGYRTVTLNRSAHAGGLAVIHRSSFTAKIQDTPNTTNFEHLLIRITVDAQNSFSFLLLYRPPGKKICRFHGELADLITSIYIKHPNLTILGDFNNKFNRPNDPNTKKLNSYMDTLDLNQLVRGKTHKEGHTLDAIYANQSTTNIVGTYPVYWTDHWIINFHIKLKQRTLQPSSLTPNQEPTRRWGKMLHNPKVTEWFAGNLPSPEQLNNATTGPKILDACIREAVQLFAPTKQPNRNKQNQAGWFTPEIKKLKIEHRTLERGWRKNQEEYTRVQLIMQRRRLNYMIKSKKKRTLHGRNLKLKEPIEGTVQNNRGVHKPRCLTYTGQQIPKFL